MVDSVSKLIFVPRHDEVRVEVFYVLGHIVNPAINDENVQIAVFPAVLSELELLVYVLEPREVGFVVLVSQMRHREPFRKSHHVYVVDEVVLVSGEYLDFNLSYGEVLDFGIADMVYFSVLRPEILWGVYGYSEFVEYGHHCPVRMVPVVV